MTRELEELKRNVERNAETRRYVVQMPCGHNEGLHIFTPKGDTPEERRRKDAELIQMAESGKFPGQPVCSRCLPTLPAAPPMEVLNDGTD